MIANGQTICLSMIVKNEAPVVERCLASVKPFVTHWVVVDTGSTDGTQAVVRRALGDLPGELHERPWRDFAHNRTEALDLARQRADYVLVIDADDTLEPEPGFCMPALSADAYLLRIADSNVVYERPQVVRSALPWVWRGVLHEFLSCGAARPAELLPGLGMRRNHDGARRRDPHTFRRDAAILEAALEAESEPFMLARYRFYLAQSYKDCGEKAKAAENYLLRGGMGFWDEEVFVSLLRAAGLMGELGRPFDEVLATYERATAACPRRAEALHGASRFCRLNGRNRDGYAIAARGLGLPVPANGLFVEPWIYEWGLLDEYATNAYWAGAPAECLDACLKLLGGGKLPAEHRERVAANARFATQNLPRDLNLGLAGSDGFLDQHSLAPRRELLARRQDARVLVAILAKQMEAALPLYLECLRAQDYPKSSIVLYVRTNNNTDGTERVLREWLAQHGHLYADVEFDATDVPEQVQRYGLHEWNPTRFRVLGQIRDESMHRAIRHGCDFYFTADVDNFVRPCTLRELVGLDLPIVAPFLRSVVPGDYYSNYHAEVDANGYYVESDQYRWALNRWVRGLIEMPVVHCTYLVRADVIPLLTYRDGSDRHEYVVFADSARRNNATQYLDNRQVYGYLARDDIHAHTQQARALLAHELSLAAEPVGGGGTPGFPGANEKAHRGAASPRRPGARPAGHPEGREMTEPANQRPFDRIYEANEWGYGSGVGSLPLNNIKYMEFVQGFIRDNGLRSVVDLGCGDWQFSQFVDWSGAEYLGMDIVPSVVEANNRRFARDNVRFELLKDVEQVPQGDLLLCKDVLQHLPNDVAGHYVRTLKPRFRFLLITNDCAPTEPNRDIAAGEWRPVRLDRPPFDQVAPTVLSWTVAWGGWKPTDKATALIVGTR